MTKCRLAFRKFIGDIFQLIRMEERDGKTAFLTMKKILIAFAFLPILSRAQDAAVRPITHTEIIQADDSNASPDVLYERCIKWIETTFQNGNAVIEIQDTRARVISIKPLVQAKIHYRHSDYTADIRHRLKITIHPGGVKLECNGYVLTGASDKNHDPTLLTTSSKAPRIRNMNKNLMQREWDYSKKAVSEQFAATAKSLRVALRGDGRR